VRSGGRGGGGEGGPLHDSDARPAIAYPQGMNTGPSRRSAGGPSELHLATIAHRGTIWDAYLEFEEDLHHAPTYRARLRFEPPTSDEGPGSTHTTIIIIEDSYERAVAKARSFDDRQLQGLLRSALPDDEAP
jgi:hypothetical protein